MIARLMVQMLASRPQIGPISLEAANSVAVSPISKRIRQRDTPWRRANSAQLSRSCDARNGNHWYIANKKRRVKEKMSCQGSSQVT